MLGTKAIRRESVENFAREVEVDGRDAKSVKDIVDNFEIIVKEAQSCANFDIGCRYGVATVCTLAGMTLIVLAAPVSVPVSAAAIAVFAGSSALAAANSFLGMMSFTAVLGRIFGD